MSDKNWRNTTYAFPFDEGEYVCTGMTLRDYFAGQAIIPFMAWSLDQCPEDGDTSAKAATRYAKSAYLIADAMMEARK